MTASLDHQQLRRLCSVPRTPYRMGEVARTLGSLARWWLRDDVLRMAADDRSASRHWADWLLKRPTLSDSPGSCWVVFALPGASDFSLLRPAFLLPLRWREAGQPSPTLPANLQSLADKVLRNLANEHDRIGGKTWGLQPHGDLADVDLSGLHFDCDSGYAPLAGGLICLAEGGTPNTKVWASGCWGESSGCEELGFLEAKLELARDWGLVERFFMPKAKLAQAEAWRRGHGAEFQVAALDTSSEKAEKWLADYLAELSMAPRFDGDDIPAAAQDWYWSMFYRRPDAAARYYREVLVAKIIDRCRTKLPKRDHPPYTHLVSIASDNPELLHLAVGILDVKHCLVLQTADKADQFAAAEAAIRASCPACQLIPREFAKGDTMPDQFRREVVAFAQGVSPEKVVLDLTPGDKLMSFSMYGAAQPGNWLYYLRHERRRQATLPGSESPLLWPFGAAWNRGAGA